MTVFKVTDSVFRDISIQGSGAGLFVSRECNLSFSRDSFIKCVASGNGGGFSADVHSVEVLCLTFYECSAPDNGAAYHVSTRCNNITVLSTLIQKMYGFNEDGFYTHGKVINCFRDGNVTDCAGKNIVLVDFPKSDSDTYYERTNIINNTLSNGDLFYTSSFISIISCNILNNTENSFIHFREDTLNFTMSQSIISGGAIKNFSTGTARRKKIEGNVYGVEEIMKIFGEETGTVQSNITPLDIKIMNQCSLHEQTFVKKANFAYLLSIFCGIKLLLF